MIHNRLITNNLICAFILVAGLVIALSLPWLVNAHGLAAVQNDPVKPCTCFATHNDGITEFESIDARAVQYAVDQVADGGTVKLSGRCVGVNALEGHNQTVYISKRLTLEGGHTRSDWSFGPDPETYPTTLDANRSGRVAFVTGDVEVTMDSLSFTGGLANAGEDGNNGGGIWTDTNLILKNSKVYSNSAVIGAGFYCSGSGSGAECNSHLTYVFFSENSATYQGGGMYNDGNSGASSPVLIDVIFSNNSAIDSGGGMYNNGVDGASSPKLTNVEFSNNSADGNGGAIYNDGMMGDSSPDLTGVTFTGNSADLGGAMFNYGDKGRSNPALYNVTFSGNSAKFDGGAMFNSGRDSGDSSPQIGNALFSGNSANGYGGGVFNNGEAGKSSPTLTNVTFSGNAAGNSGGALHNFGAAGGICKPDVRNSIFWNNQANGVTGTISASITLEIASITLTNNLVEGAYASGSTGWALGDNYVNVGGNIDKDPMFLIPVDPSAAPTTTGNLRLKSGSPAIDTGNNTFVTGVSSDLDRVGRVADGNLDGKLNVDMGAYETQIYRYLPLVKR